MNGEASRVSSLDMEKPPRDSEGWALLTLIIKPFRLNAVLSALQPFHVEEVTVQEVRGYGRQKGHLELYRGAEYVVSFIPKLKVDLAAPRAEVPELMRALAHAARTGRIGDGKIFLYGTELILDVAEGTVV